jgi:hypothetical protein
MDIPDLIDYIGKAEKKIQEYKENDKTETSFFKKLVNYRNQQKDLYNRIMKRKTTWEPFGKALSDSENNDACTTYCDEVCMEMVDDTKIDNTRPDYFKYYNDMSIPDKMKEENYHRFQKNIKKQKIIKELYTDSGGRSYHIYVTRQVEADKLSTKYEATGVKSRSLDDLFKEKEGPRHTNNTGNDESESK